MIELRIRAGARELRDLALRSEDAFEEAIARVQDVTGFLRHEMMFDAFREGVLVFSVTPQWQHDALQPALPLPAITDRKAWLLALARAVGFPLVGIAAPTLPERYYTRFSEWLDSGGHGEMHYLERQREKRLDPQRVLTNARSVLAVATPYAPQRPGVVARYATGRDYHVLLSNRMEIVKRALYKAFPDVRIYTSVDTGPVLERAYAEQAGIGWIGKNGVLMSRTHGSYLSLATLWTTLDLAPDTAHAEFCGSCNACIEGCPTRAIVRPGWVEAQKCISYWTIEHAGPTLPDATHGWVFGCDVCQEVCPWNRFAAQPSIDGLRPLPEPFPDARAWLAATAVDVDARIAHTSLRRAGVPGLKRNARHVLRVVD